MVRSGMLEHASFANEPRNHQTVDSRGCPTMMRHPGLEDRIAVRASRSFCAAATRPDRLRVDHGPRKGACRRSGGSQRSRHAQLTRRAKRGDYPEWVGTLRGCPPPEATTPGAGAHQGEPRGTDGSARSRHRSRRASIPGRRPAFRGGGLSEIFSRARPSPRRACRCQARPLSDDGGASTISSCWAERKVHRREASLWAA